MPNRREFLRVAGLGTLGLALFGCKTEGEILPTATPATTATPAEISGPAPIPTTDRLTGSENGNCVWDDKTDVISLDYDSVTNAWARAQEVVKEGKVTIDRLKQEPLMVRFYVCLFGGLEYLKDENSREYILYISDLLLDLNRALHPQQANIQGHLIHPEHYDNCSTFSIGSVQSIYDNNLYPKGSTLSLEKDLESRKKTGASVLLLRENRADFFIFLELLSEIYRENLAEDRFFYYLWGTILHEMSHSIIPLDPNTVLAKQNPDLNDVITNDIRASLDQLPEDIYDRSKGFVFESRGAQLRVYFYKPDGTLQESSIGDSTKIEEAFAEMHREVIYRKMGILFSVANNEYRDPYTKLTNLLQSLTYGTDYARLQDEVDAARPKGLIAVLEACLKNVPKSDYPAKRDAILSLFFKL